MQAGLVTLLGLGIVIGALLIIALSDSDDAVTCRAPETVSRFRGIGIGAGTIFTRIFARRSDVDPPQSDPNPDLVSWMFEAPLPDNVNMPATTNLLWAWLQFIDNDISMFRSTDSNTVFGGATAPTLNRDDYVLDSRGNRQQINYASPYLDMSHIYGNDLASYNAIRRNDGSGKLNTSYTPNQPIGEDEMPAYDAVTKKFVHLDARYEDNPILTALYVLFVREHNYWADIIRQEHPYMNDNEIYNTARHITIAEIQSITYTTFLPMLLGGDNSRFSGTCFTDPSFRGNDDDDIAHVVDEYLHRTTVYNEWTTACATLYQTFVPDTIELRDLDNTTVVGTLFMGNDSHTAEYVWQNGIGEILLGAALQKSEERDPVISDAIRRHNGATKDLSAIAIARGRDHQLPPYQIYYNQFFDRHHVTCNQYVYNTDYCTDIDAVYGVNEHIDLFAGLLSEKQHIGIVLGPVAAEIFIQQFKLLRNNDYYFYLWDDVVSHYKAAIHRSTLATIIARNTNIAKVDLPKNVFRFQ